MRPTTAILAGFLTQSVSASPWSCLEEKILEPTDRCHSSRSLNLQACISDILDDLTQRNLQACFEEAGCGSLDAEFEAQWVVESCVGETELRRRQDDEDETTTAEDEEETTTAEATTTATAAEETTTEDATTGTTASDATTTGETTVDTTDASTTDTTATSLQCSTTIDGTTKCIDGLVCSTDGCMVADNSLDASGVAVAIFFGASLTISFLTLILLCCRDRRKDKALRAQMEAAKAAKETAKPAVVAGTSGRSVSAGRRSPMRPDRQPLMNQGMYPPSPGGSASGRPSHDPFGDQRRG